MAAGTAASTGGAMMNANSQNRAIEETNQQNRKAQEINAQARQQEAERQRVMEEQQAADVAKALFEADPAAALLRAQDTVRAPTNEITQAAAAYNEDPAPQRIENASVNAAAKPYQKESRARTNTVAEAIAMLSAIGGEFSGANNQIDRAGGRISTTGVNRRASAGVAQREAGIPAADVTAGDSPIGDILILGGQLASGIGGQRAGRAGAGGIGDILKRKPKGMPNPKINTIAEGGLY
jgi:hypothetical protein